MLYLVALPTITLISYLDHIASSPLAFASHLVLAALIGLMCHWTSDSERASLFDAAASAFFVLFYVVSPAVQLLGDNRQLVNTSWFNGDYIAAANTSAGVLIGAYLFCRSRLRWGNPSDTNSRTQTHTHPVGLRQLSLALPLSAAGFSFAVAKFGDQSLGIEADAITPLTLILFKFVFFIPCAIYLIWIQQLSESPLSTYSRYVPIVFAILLIALTQNPLLEKRNSLGPVYLTVTYALFFPALRSPKAALRFLLAATTVVLPLLATFTHNSSSDWADAISDLSVNSLVEHFQSINYDAWANATTTAEIVDKFGHEYGQQLLGALLFFVPREIWPDKPEATGIVIGNYLIDYHAGWFTNLSAPLPAEIFIDFGYFGCLIFGILFGIVGNIISSQHRKPTSTASEVTYAYFSFFAVFLLRGSLLVAIAYGVANALAFAVASRLTGKSRGIVVRQ